MRKASIAFAVVAIVIVAAMPALPRKKHKKESIKAQLRSLHKIYVEGSSDAVSYIRLHLADETCLIDSRTKSDADAVLQIYEENPVPCTGEPMVNNPIVGGCSHIQAKLFNPLTKKLLWYREDRHLPVALIQHPRESRPYDWVLWNLSNSICKERPATSSQSSNN